MMTTYDVVVLGTGAAGLTAALSAHDAGARVAVFEKAEGVGGTSAWSGGMVWIPNNHHMHAAGVTDSTQEAVEYLMSMSHGMMDRRLIETFVTAGPRMVCWLEEQTPVKFQLVGYFPDYHPEHLGGKSRGGRSLECPMYSFDELGAWASRVSTGEFYTEVITTMGETPLGQAIPKEIPVAELERRRALHERGCGQSLIARLLKGCLDRGIEPRTQARARELIVREGRVVGVRFDSEQDSFEVGAGGGVVLATGGFEWNQDLVRAFLRGPMTHAVSVPTNTGDGLQMAMRVGASLGNMREAWWLPVAEIPRDDKPPLISLITCERTFPRSIMINRDGKRFTNEAANYNAFGAAFHEIDVARFDYRNLPSWLIFDHEYLRRYGFGWVATPSETAPSWMMQAPTLDALAERLGVPGAALAATVARWNQQVASGGDPDFQRGNSANDRWWGDPARKGERAATLGPLEKPPFYAVEIKSGTLGTKGGPRVDTDARVIDFDGKPIPGLYAAGNVMASPMGMTYGGAGGTLAPAMVFGFLAGSHAAKAGR